MAKKGGLGRGLNYLFEESLLNPDPASIINPENNKENEKPAEDADLQAEAVRNAAAAEKEEKGEKVIYVDINNVKPNSKQPRKQFDEEALQELAGSIKEYGVIQPVLVRPSGQYYELVAGERRWRAARIAGLKEIPAISRDLDDRQNAFYALIENVQRENLNAIEEAEGIRQMIDEYGLSQQEAADAVGKSRPYIANAVRLLALPGEVKEYVTSGKLSAGHARAIAGLKTEALQLEAAKLASEEGWSVRKIESYTGLKQDFRKRKSRAMKKKAKSLEISGIEEELKQKLGTKVILSGTDRKGALTIEYYSREELEQLIEILMK